MRGGRWMPLLRMVMMMGMAMVVMVAHQDVII
jgi:hypothetical protein